MDFQFYVWNLQMRCHFGATYMDGMNGDPPFLFEIFQGDLIMKAYAKFDEILTAECLQNWLTILGVTVKVSNPLVCL